MVLVMAADLLQCSGIAPCSGVWEGAFVARSGVKEANKGQKEAHKRLSELGQVPRQVLKSPFDTGSIQAFESKAAQALIPLDIPEYRLDGRHAFLHGGPSFGAARPVSGIQALDGITTHRNAQTAKARLAAALFEERALCAADDF